MVYVIKVLDIKVLYLSTEFFCLITVMCTNQKLTLHVYLYSCLVYAPNVIKGDVHHDNNIRSKSP